MRYSQKAVRVANPRYLLRGHPDTRCWDSRGFNLAGNPRLSAPFGERYEARMAYWKMVTKRAWRRSLELVRWESWERIIVFLIGLIVPFAAVWYLVGDTTGAAVRALASLGGSAIPALVVFVWSLIRLPAMIHAEGESERAKLAAQIESAAAKRAVREELGGFLDEGNQLMVKLGKDPAEATEADAQDWLDRLNVFIDIKLDKSYKARMDDYTMLPPKYGKAPGQLPEVWMGVRAINFHVGQFVSELATVA